MNITTCPKCGKCYEEVSEEMANSYERMCRACYEKHVGAGVLALPDDWYPADTEEGPSSRREREFENLRADLLRAERDRDEAESLNHVAAGIIADLLRELGR